MYKRYTRYTLLTTETRLVLSTDKSGCSRCDKPLYQYGLVVRPETYKITTETYELTGNSLTMEPLIVTFSWHDLCWKRDAANKLAKPKGDT